MRFCKETVGFRLYSVNPRVPLSTSKSCSARPELHYQVGATLENCEKPVCRSDTDCRKIIQALDPKERPLDLEQSHSDPKCRFFYRMEERSPNVPASDYLENVIPESFKEVWQSRMDSWGEQMKAAVEGVAVMLSDGLGLDPQTLVQAGRYGCVICLRRFVRTSGS